MSTLNSHVYLCFPDPHGIIVLGNFPVSFPRLTCCVLHAWNFIEQRPFVSVAIALVLVPLLTFPIDLKIFHWKCLLQIKNGPALQKMKLLACVLACSLILIFNFPCNNNCSVLHACLVAPRHPVSIFVVLFYSVLFLGPVGLYFLPWMEECSYLCWYCLVVLLCIQ